MAKKKPAPRPQRTSEHKIASQSHNYIEKYFIDKGHTVARPPEDYGTDVSVHTFDENGYKEAGEIQLQLKARSTFKYSQDGEYILFQIEAKHYAYYLYMQEYFTAGKPKKPKKNAKKMTVRVPVTNRFTKPTVDYMRDRKAAILKQIQGKVKHEA